MKKCLFLFLMLAVSAAYGAKKDKKDPKDLIIDSLTTATKTLQNKLDSANGELDKVYLVLKERIVKRDFNHSQIPHVIDSIATEIDSSMTGMRSNTTTLMDSLTTLKKENEKMKGTLNGILNDESSKSRLVYELKQLKELLDAKILTPAEFDVKKTRLLEKWQ